MLSAPGLVQMTRHSLVLNRYSSANFLTSGSGIKVLKRLEGQFNKAFLLTIDNGMEVFAKLLNPNAGPEFFTTASEVATRHFLRDPQHTS
jgi:hypothetical protein